MPQLRPARGHRPPTAAGAAARGASYGSGGDWHLAGDTGHGPGGRTFALPGAADLPGPDRDDALAAAVAALLCGVPAAEIEARSRALADAAPRYRRTARRLAGRLVVNDSASCMPASTAALVGAMAERFVLICGGDRQRYRPGEFDALAAAVAASPHAALVCTTGPMAGHLERALCAAGFDALARCTGIPDAVDRALGVAEAAVVFSPGCGTGSLFLDKYERGESFDDAVSARTSGVPEADGAVVPDGEAAP